MILVLHGSNEFSWLNYVAIRSTRTSKLASPLPLSQPLAMTNGNEEHCLQNVRLIGDRSRQGPGGAGAASLPRSGPTGAATIQERPPNLYKSVRLERVQLVAC